MPGPVFLEGETVELRTIEPEDAETCQRLVNDPRVREGTRRVTPVTRSDEEAWIEDPGEDEYPLAVCVDGEFVGVIGLLDVDDRVGTGEVGYQLLPEAWGNGYATDAACTVARYAFAQRGLEKLNARVLETNDASARVLEKVGFQREGTFRAQDFYGGERLDVHWYGLLAEEYEGR